MNPLKPLIESSGLFFSNPTIYGFCGLAAILFVILMLGFKNKSIDRNLIIIITLYWAFCTVAIGIMAIYQFAFINCYQPAEEEKVGHTKVEIAIMDNNSGASISGANITIEGDSKTTNECGKAIFYIPEEKKQIHYYVKHSYYGEESQPAATKPKITIRLKPKGE